MQPLTVLDRTSQEVKSHAYDVKEQLKWERDQWNIVHES